MEEMSMALVKCPECKRKISKDCTVCPKCGANIRMAQNRKKGKGKIALIICFVFLFLCFIISISPKFKLENTSTTKAEASTNINVIEDVSKFSRISPKELTDLLGDPVDTENWTNKTSKGNFDVTTMSYDLNENHYEFIVADDAVVRLTIYSNDYWNNQGERFSYEGVEKEQLPELFSITLSNNAKVNTDNNFTYKMSPVSDKVAIFDVQDIDTSTKTFGFVKITYNLNYFD